MPSQDVPASPAARIGSPVLLRQLVESAADLYCLGDCTRYCVINVGYEDCNVLVRTPTGDYVLKLFSAGRVPGVAGRTLMILEAAIAAGVRHPRLIRNRLQETLHRDAASGIQFLVMDFIAGGDFYTLGRAPDRAELRTILEQAVRIHSVSVQPAFVHDPWAVQNLRRLYEDVRTSLCPSDQSLVEQTIRAMSAIDHDALPIRLVHGDLTKGNVLRSARGDIFLLDFAVANSYPRIQEIAVIAANLMHGCQESLEQRVNLLCDMYSERSRLSETEHDAAIRYALAATAMELLGAQYEIERKDNDNAETRDVLEIGRCGLRAAAELIQRCTKIP